MLLVLSLTSLWVVVVSGPASAASQLVDPVFGLTYDPAKIRFEQAPTDLLTVCPALSSGRWTRELWIYAKTATEGGSLLIVGGLYRPRPGVDGKPMTDPKGAVIDLKGKNCTLLGPAREVLDYPEQLISPAMLDRLDNDLVHRYRAAWGGAATLIAALREQHVTLDAPPDRMLRDALGKKSEQ
jgi:hypothetical protein